MLNIEITSDVARTQERELFAFRHWKIAGLIRLRPPDPPSVLPPRYFLAPTCYLPPSCALFAEITSKIAKLCTFDTHLNQQRSGLNNGTCLVIDG